jgi:methionyl-tRNA formyltransferase
VRAGGPACEIACVILAGSPGERPSELERLATRAGVPAVWVASIRETIAALRHVAPDVALAACFPWRLPRAAREIPPLGILNIHPSLLPLGRGPEPVFWTLRRGEPSTGTTLHLMDAGFDTGPIVAQDEMAIPPSIRAPALEDTLMARGAELLAEVLPALAAGDLHPRPQPSSGATEAPTPAPHDWTMLASLPAAWAWRFARGVAPLGGPLAVITGGTIILVRDALAWSPDERLSQAVEEADDGTVRVRFTPGWVRFERAAG